MKIRLIENGLDSLKKGFKRMNEYEISSLRDSSSLESHFILKDALLAIHHGIEILLKELLSTHNEILVFSEIGENLKKAYSELHQKNLKNVFHSTIKVHTVSFSEAIDRLKKICGVQFSKDFKRKLDKLDEYRNCIVHSEINLDEFEIRQTLDGLADEVDTFFINAIGQQYSSITGYSDLKNNYSEYINRLKKKKLDLKSRVFEVLIKTFDDNSISIGEGDFKVISDINKVTSILREIYKSRLMLGADWYNLDCSGHVSKISRVEGNRFEMYPDDNGAKYIFRFGKFAIYFPEVESDFSPIFFFEASEDSPICDNESFVRTDYVNRKFVSGLSFPEENRIEWDPEKINEFECRREYDEYFVCPQFSWVEQFLSPGVFCFLNIQGLEYGNVRRFLEDIKEKSLKDVEVAIKNRNEKGRTV